MEFSMNEIMEGTHKFEEGFGPEGEHPMCFEVRWGSDSIKEFFNPFGERFLVSEMNGTVTVGGLCVKAPCSGTLALRYFNDATIVYDFKFRAGGKNYRCKAKKINIKPWNLAVSHTTCFGTVVEESQRSTGPRCIFWRIPAFLLSLRLK